MMQLTFNLLNDTITYNELQFEFTSDLIKTYTFPVLPWNPHHYRSLPCHLHLISLCFGLK